VRPSDFAQDKTTEKLIEIQKTGSEILLFTTSF
jgi:hypothetical protein